MKGFREFILRGNVIDLAVAVVVGAAFAAIVNAIVTGVLSPFIGALFDAGSLAKAFPVTIPTVSGGTATMHFGAVIAALLQFLLVAVVLYFVFVMPMNRMRARAEARRAAGTEDTPPNEVDLLTEIRDLLAADAESSAHKHAAE